MVRRLNGARDDFLAARNETTWYQGAFQKASPASVAKCQPPILNRNARSRR
jgi:hypothetical protein